MDKESILNSESDLNAVLEEVVSDVAAPSPVADMPQDTSTADRPVEALPGGDAPPHDAPAGKRGRGRPRKDSGTAGQSKASSPRPKVEGVSRPSVQPVDFDNAGIEPCAEIAVLMVSTTGMALGGQEAAMRPEESLLAKNGFIAYFKAKGINDVPAWIVLAGALSPYLMRVVSTTPAKKTLTTFFSRAWFGTKEFFRNRKNARSNRRDNLKRENNSSEKTGENSISDS